jgi:hypothetical protein
MTQYTASNTDNQVIDTFALATVKAIDYQIHAVDNSDESISIVTITHNGISISETQESTSVGNNQPAEFTTSITNANTGQVLVTPSSAPVTYTLTRTDTAANLYGEHTVSGKLIKHTEGVGIYFTGSANNMTVRASNAYFGNSSQFVTADVLGPTMIGDELFDSNNFVSYNSSSLAANDTYTVIESSGQNRSSHYIEIQTVVGEKYRVQANTFYTFDPVYSQTDTIDKGSRIAVGSSVGLSDLTYVQLTKTEAQYNLDFIATGNTAFVSFGHGTLGTSVSARSISIKEVAPFPTYNQSNGTFYFKWNAIAADSNVAVMNSNRVFVDSSNNVFINTVNCGAQQATNKLAYTYDGNIVQHSFNGAAVLSESETYYSNVTSCSLATVPEEMSYVPVVISNTNLTGLTS